MSVLRSGFENKCLVDTEKSRKEGVKDAAGSVARADGRTDAYGAAQGFYTRDPLGAP